MYSRQEAASATDGSVITEGAAITRRRNDRLQALLAGVLETGLRIIRFVP